MKLTALVFLLMFVVPLFAHSEETPPKNHLFPHPENCSEMEVWDEGLGMCMPFPMQNMPMTMVMVHGNAFLTQTHEESPRGRDAFSIPNMFMADVGTSVGDNQYLNLDYMGTLEKWTFPAQGYPELLQEGETDANGNLFLDAQHPHSSPTMGLTLSDTIGLGHGKNYLKLFFAPRGESTDGPIAFMHRLTGMINPDAPLGHHIGQDVGHISSTVAGASLRWGDTTLEMSGFHGEEPQPTSVDLPIGPLDSYGLRLIQRSGPHFAGMISFANVKNPENDLPGFDHIQRYSASLYWEKDWDTGWILYDSVIYGLINHYDQAASLSSFTEEFWLHKDAANLWGRIEAVQRTPAELEIGTLGDPNKGLWVGAWTLGYTHQLTSWEHSLVGLGASITKDFLPVEFQPAYGGGDPLTYKIFLQLSGMNMWHF